MKNLLKILFSVIGIVIGIFILILLIEFLWISVSGNRTAKKYTALAGPEVEILTTDGLTFRDLNKNGVLDLYEDTRRTTMERICHMIRKNHYLSLDPD